MTAPVPSADALRDWLGSEQGLAALTGAARQVVRRLRHCRLHTALEQMGIGPHTPMETAVDEVRGELCRFVLENAHRLAPAMAAPGIDAGRYLCQAFVYHCRDLERGSGGDPFRLHYRRVAEAMRRDERFFTETLSGGGIRYSLALQSRPVAPLADEDLSAIAPGDVSIDEPGGPLHCARLFWQALQARFGGQAVWIDLRDLIRWLRFHGRLPVKPAAVSLNEELAAVLPAPAESSFDAERVEQWAAMFANSLDPLDRRIWWLRFGRGLGFQKIAIETGAYRSASGAQARIARLGEMLRDFVLCHDLPWIGPDEIDEQAWAVFYDALLAAVEKDPATPSSQGKALPSPKGPRRKDAS